MSKSHRISARSFSGSFQINAMADWPILLLLKVWEDFWVSPAIIGNSFLTMLMKNDGFLWMPEAIAAFHKLKELMLSPKFLGLNYLVKVSTLMEG
ncbi:hypothetical protein Prudu_012958 [Prunus dulcis]|uniref:Uncharacterized protein n=1 Tax=Prunus dulcis TaxID=3755 RepID=A0A4Y1RE15_PRUDU|nr:hypothetical protein Prudu_012958 [Prunus dulcis]